MFCPECGAQNNDGSKFCCNCAKPLVATAYNDANKKVVSKKLHMSFLMNIISAVVLPIAYFFFKNGGLSTPEGITSGANAPYPGIYVGAVIAVIGFAMYFIKNESTKKVMAYVYLVGALIATCMQLYAGVETISYTCGFGFILTVSGILQIVAAVNAVSALKNA